MLIGSAPPVLNELPTSNPPAPFPENIWTIPLGCAEVESGGTPGTVAAMSSFPSPLKSARARAVGMNARPLVTVLIRLTAPVPSPWKTVMLLPKMVVCPWSESPKPHTTTSGLVSPLVTWAIPTQQALLDPVEIGDCADRV